MMQKSKTTKSKKSGRVTGEAVLYFFLHNLISVGFFFLFTINLELYDGSEVSIAFLFTSEFWEMVIFDVLLFSVISSIIGRASAYGVMRVYFKYGKKNKQMKRWTELNSGINKFSLVIFLLTAFITAVVYSLGMIFILQDRIFNEDSLSTLVATYILFKVGVFFLVRWFIGAKT